MKVNSNYFLSAVLMLFTSILFFSCQQGPQFDETKLNGQWKVADWKILSTGESRSNKMDMSFNSDGTYVVDYGSEKEKGKYWVNNESLVTVETGASEKSVKILSLNSDTLFFQMNRGGELENVLLLR